MKKYRKLACILAGSMTMSLFAGCIGNGDVVPEEKNESTDTEEPTASETSQEIKKAESRDIDQIHLRDKDSLYENDDDTSVVTMYLTVSKGNSSENTDHTWEEINSYSVYDYEEKEVYIDRLKRMPTIIEMPYNEVVQKFIDRYSGKLRRSVSFMLGASTSTCLSSKRH